MRQLRTRARATPLGDADVVVPGGTMQILDVAFAVEKCRSEYGVLGLSVYAGAGLGVEELCMTAAIPHSRIRTATVEDLRRAVDISLLPTFHAPHYTLGLPDGESATIRAVCDAFGSPMPNPATSRR